MKALVLTEESETIQLNDLNETSAKAIDKVYDHLENYLEALIALNRLIISGKSF